jgi:ABC-type sulfate transport system permease component
LNISGTLGGGSEGDSNKIVKSLTGVVVVGVVVNVLVVVNVVEDGMTEVVDGVTGNEKR